MAHQVSWHFQHINLDVIDVTFLWFLWQIYLMPTNPFIHFPMAQRWSDRFFSGNLLMLLVSSAQLPALSQIIFSFSAQKPRLAQKQQHKQQQQQTKQQTKQQTIAKPFQNLSGLGFDWLQFKRGANEVQTRSEIKFWETDPLSLLTYSLGATRFRILFRTVKLKSIQRWSRRGNQAKQQLQARAKGDRRGDKGRVRETEGRQRDRDSQVSTVCQCEVPQNTSVS